MEDYAVVFVSGVTAVCVFLMMQQYQTWRSQQRYKEVFNGFVEFLKFGSNLGASFGTLMTLEEILHTLRANATPNSGAPTPKLREMPANVLLNDLNMHELMKDPLFRELIQQTIDQSSVTTEKRKKRRDSDAMLGSPQNVKLE